MMSKYMKIENENYRNVAFLILKSFNSDECEYKLKREVMYYGV